MTDRTLAQRVADDRRQEFTFRPTSENDINVMTEGVVTHYGPGICDRFAPYGNDSFEEAVRDYCGDVGLVVVSVSEAEVVAEVAS